MVPLFQSLLFSSKSNGVITINKEVQVNFIQSDKKHILLYFGYVGCANICTPFLSKLSLLYESDKFKILKGDTQVIFVNLNPDTVASQVDMFAKTFNQNFNGIYIPRKEILSIDRNLGLFFSDSLTDKMEINHTDYLYLIDNQKNIKILKNIYFTHPLRSQQLIDDMISKNDMME